ncbi:hypothetical protein [Thiobaca trueperi]|uniref:Uncharacterized protein n=1 Tax=Thiobaca trueperi TaxID=127458 RepID=A0A4R3MYN4_9GAMM|nr:hypothetical protein [Thiobaca trueperi]TCT19863.1 hypothetical protein EDC35_107191 [Thiobaca trueperi]
MYHPSRTVGKAISRQDPTCEQPDPYNRLDISRKTLRGWWKTPHYRTPPMPWGIGRDRMAPTLGAWVPDLAEINSLPFVFPRGWYSLLSQTLTRVSWLRDRMPGITRVRFGDQAAPRFAG